jgi:hypothetical protein
VVNRLGFRRATSIRFGFTLFRGVERTNSGRDFHPLKSSAFHGALLRQQPITDGDKNCCTLTRTDRKSKLSSIFDAGFSEGQSNKEKLCSA